MVASMVLLEEEGIVSFSAEPTCRVMRRSVSCGGLRGRQRSMTRWQHSIADCCTRQRAGSTGARGARRAVDDAGERPPVEVQLRPEQNEEPKQRYAKEQINVEETDDGLLIACDLVAEWVDTLANDLIQDDVGYKVLISHDEPCFTQSGDVEVWETVSMGSFEEWDNGDVLEFIPQLTLSNASFLEPYALPAKEDEAPVVELKMPEDTLVRAAVLEANELEDIVRAASPLLSTPAATASSRSSTPSRSVRNRRRIIGGIKRSASPAWDFGVDALPHQSPSPAATSKVILQMPRQYTPTNMRHAASTSALALDLGIENASSALKTGEQYESQASSLEGRKLIMKCKSLGSLQMASSKQGLGLLPPKQGLLPMLSDQQSTKSDLIAWRVNISKSKRSGLRLAF